jgi:hypothetical protein
MEAAFRGWGMRAAAMAALLAVVPHAGAAEAPIEEMRQELEAMKEQLRQMQERIRKQEETIEKLRVEKQPAVPTPSAAAPAPPAASAPPVVAATPKPPWSPSQPISLFSVGKSYLNISFDGLVDAGWSTTPHVQQLELGDHDPIQRGFTIPNEEIFFDGAVDPYFKGVADIVFKLNQDNETDVELEEAYLTTTSLPWNLQAKSGEFFSEFGRLNTQHPHAWDFVDQPLVIGRMFGPEGLRNPGARLSWLAPTPFYSELFVAAQDSQGTTAFSFRNTNDALFGRQPVDRPVSNLGDLLYVPRYVASFDLTDSQTIVTGISGAFGPNASGQDTRTAIYGGDVFWKWKPSWQSGGFPFVSVQAEALGRRYEAGASNGLPSETLYDWGTYAQVVYGFMQRWTAGLRGDWVSSDSDSSPSNPNSGDRLRVSPDVTFYPTEFSKVRLQYNYDHGQQLGNDSSVWVQLEFLLGAHAAHKF